MSSLPPVIGSSVQLAPLIVPVVPEEKVSENKRYIFCISKDLSYEDKENLRDNGRVLYYNHDLMSNLPPSSFDFDYLVVDLRNKNDRYFFLKEVKPIENLFYVILYCHKFEVEDLSNIAHYDNVLCKLPMKQARKVDFNNLLLVERLPAPSCFLSLAKYIFRAYNSAK
jgi:hypothetical protein